MSPNGLLLQAPRADRAVNSQGGGADRSRCTRTSGSPFGRFPQSVATITGARIASGNAISSTATIAAANTSGATGQISPAD